MTIYKLKHLINVYTGSDNTISTFHFMNLQIGKTFAKAPFYYYSGTTYGFDDWERDAKLDGWICRNDKDCSWIDEHLGCDDRSFYSAKLKVLYFK